MASELRADGIVKFPYSQELHHTIKTIDTLSLTTLSISRLSETALPHIGLIELVSSSTFTNLYDDLYKSTFPNSLERERSDLIVTRLDDEWNNQRQDLSPYHIVGIRDHGGVAIGACQFSVLFLNNTGYAVPYIQYIYVRQTNRRQDMAGVLHMLTLAVASADASKRSCSVPFILFETEPAGYGDDDASRAWATQRSTIHTKGGAVALMLQRSSDGVLISPHVQPGLEVEDPPLSLVWAVRNNPAQSTVDIGQIAHILIAAYYQSLRDEGFPEANIRKAEEIVAKRTQGSTFLTMPLSDVVLTNESRLLPRPLDKTTPT